MGIVHHSNYLKYYETARWELFRSLGFSYKSIEERGYMLPVIRLSSRYVKAIHYDDQITIESTLKSLKGARVWFAYKLYNSIGELVNEGETELAFVKKENMKPCPVPEFILNVILVHSAEN
jgi:acyl-CoA thioester hydrolase